VASKIPQPRLGTPDPRLSETEFRARFLSQFSDPAFDALRYELDRVAAVAWDAYDHGRKAPRTRKAGAGFADPEYDLSLDWIAARDAIRAAQARHEDPAAPASILLISASARSEHTCPGEMSKSYRLVQIAREVHVVVRTVAYCTAYVGSEQFPVLGVDFLGRRQGRAVGGGGLRKAAPAADK
jgi:hypothetical protein